MIDALLLSSDVLLCVSRFFFSIFFSFSSVCLSLSLSLSLALSLGSATWWQLLCNVFLRLLFAVGAYLALTLHRSNRVGVVYVRGDISWFLCACSRHIDISKRVNTGKQLHQHNSHFLAKWKNKKKQAQFFVFISFSLSFSQTTKPNKFFFFNLSFSKRVSFKLLNPMIIYYLLSDKLTTEIYVFECRF